VKATEDPTLAAAIGYLLSSRGRTTSPTRMAAGYDRGLSWRMGYPSGVPPRASVNQLVFERFQECVLARTISLRWSYSRRADVLRASRDGGVRPVAPT
jgi:hypothetical protein